MHSVPARPLINQFANEWKTAAAKLAGATVKIVSRVRSIRRLSILHNQPPYGICCGVRASVCFGLPSLLFLWLAPATEDMQYASRADKLSIMFWWNCLVSKGNLNKTQFWCRRHIAYGVQFVWITAENRWEMGMTVCVWWSLHHAVSLHCGENSDR